LNAAEYKEAKQGIHEYIRIKNNGTPHECAEAYIKVMALLRCLDDRPTNLKMTLHSFLKAHWSKNNLVW
jgi:hypothetical protein